VEHSVRFTDSAAAVGAPHSPLPATSIKTSPSALHLPTHLMTRFNHPVLGGQNRPDLRLHFSNFIDSHNYPEDLRTENLHTNGKPTWKENLLLLDTSVNIFLQLSSKIRNQRNIFINGEAIKRRELLH